MSQKRSVAAVIVRDGLVLLARRGFSGPLARLWEFPGGKIEAGENDEVALTREFTEEFGARIQPLQLLTEVSFLHKGSDRELAAWLAYLPESERLELSEHSELTWASCADVRSLDLVDSDRLILPSVLAHLALTR